MARGGAGAMGYDQREQAEDECKACHHDGAEAERRADGGLPKTIALARKEVPLTEKSSR
jgi:hypothetical protein